MILSADGNRSIGRKKGRMQEWPAKHVGGRGTDSAEPAFFKSSFVDLCSKNVGHAFEAVL